MKIAFFTYPNTNQNVGGLQMRVKRTREALKSEGMEVTLFDIWNHRVTDFDVLHVFKLHHSTCELVLTAKQRGVKVVISTVIPPEFRKKLMGFLGPVWDRGFARSLTVYSLYEQARIADGLIGVSNAEARLLTQAFRIPADRIHTVHNCADASVYGNADPESFRHTHRIPDGYILSVGRVEPNKNQLNLIRAMRTIDNPLVIVGRVSDDALGYGAACREAGRSNVHFIETLPYNSAILASAYAGAEAFVLPSHSEIAPNSSLEAAMAGTRVIVTENALAPYEWFGDEAFYVNPSDEKHIASTIERALSQPKNECLRERIIRDFSWEAGTRKLIEIYRNLQ